MANCRRTRFASRGNEEPVMQKFGKLLIFSKQIRMMDRTKKYSISFGYGMEWRRFKASGQQTSAFGSVWSKCEMEVKQVRGLAK